MYIDKGVCAGGLKHAHELHNKGVMVQNEGRKEGSVKSECGGGRRGESDVEVETDLVVVLEAAAAVGSTVLKSCYCSKSKRRRSHTFCSVRNCSQIVAFRIGRSHDFQYY